MKDTTYSIDPNALPAFCLFKNLVLSDPYSPASPIISFGWVKLSNDREELEREVPAPTIPANAEIVDIMRRMDRFEDIVDPDTDRIQEDELSFDLTRDHLVSPPTDVDLFGESYTLLLVCPGKVDIVSDYLIGELQKNTQGKQITGIDLYYLWNDYVDRLLFYSPSEHDIGESEPDLWNEVVDELTQRIKMLPNAPSEEDWNEMERYL